MKKVFAAIAAFVCLVVVLPGQSSAVTPSESSLGELVFSNAGRIISIRADGSERTILTRQGARTGSRDFVFNSLGLGDRHPRISPDGERIAFIRTTDEDEVFRERLMVGNRDGTGLKAVLDFRNSYMSSVDWTPDGHLIVSATAFIRKDGKEREIYQQRLIQADPDSGKVEILVSEKPGGFLSGPWLEAEDVSPDGRSLLFTRSNMKQVDLRVKSLENGSERRVAFGAFGASFSPDGSRIVFSAAPCYADDDQNCGSSKWKKRGLWTVGADGSGARRLNKDRSAMNPSYSPDGSRIAFASARNSPGSPDTAYEIYSMAPDGGCLTWLTNGSPASAEPSWAPEADADYSPGTCGAAGRRPLVELRPLPARKTDPKPRLWAGPRVGSRLLTSMGGYWPGSRSDLYAYADCAYFEPGRCSRPLSLEVTPVCYGFDELVFGKRAGTLKKRGVKVFRTRNKGRLGATLLASGTGGVGIGETLLTESRLGRKNTFADHLRVIAQLRPVGRPLVPGSKLPARVKVDCDSKR